jgi:uncharacterized protein (DUF433 family)
MIHPLGMPEVFSDPEIHGGQPIIESGIPIYLILDMLAQEFSPEEMRRDYGISDEDVRIALRFAAEYLKREGNHAADLAIPTR